MRLLNTRSLTLRFFIGSDVPPYVILSHTWGADEVLLEHVLNGTARFRSGFEKVAGSCRKADQDDFEWIWIDTCCIDKSSSAELSEAINSMYQWYRESTVCYAYLTDVKAGSTTGTRQSFAHAQLRSSRWFTRGWTLQELIAPRSVEFYAADWTEIGTKASITAELSQITGIPVQILRGTRPPSSRTIAERMSWASQRQTTRLEDMAYCLLGIFDVNMPMLYGEGNKAFLRLQEEIMAREEGYSIFAWTLQTDCGDQLTGLLASSPAEFSIRTPPGLQRPVEGRWIPDMDDQPKVEYIAPSSGPKNPNETVWKVVDHFGQRLRNKYSEKFPSWSIPEATRKSILSDARMGSDEAKKQVREMLGEFSRLRVIFDKNYSSLPKFRLRGNWGSIPAPEQPPSVSSRGLHLTLPVWQLEEDRSLPLVAWIYSEVEGEMLCILLQESAEHEGLVARHSSPWLIGVDSSLRHNFQPRSLVVHPSGPLVVDKSLLQGHGNDSDISWGRINIVIEENVYEPQLVSVYPPKIWNMDELFFSGEPDLIGILVFEVTDDNQTHRFGVSIGVIKSHQWCVIKELPVKAWGWNSAVVAENIYLLERDLVKDDCERSDRARSSLSCMSLQASLRMRPASMKNSRALTLQISASHAGS